jgi:Protein of unknown function (DUF664)
MSAEPVEPPLTGPERAMLEGWLDYHRATLPTKCAGLDEVFTGPRGGRLVECSLRWIYNHMIEEYAQHNGHADLIRELIDGTVSS